MTEIRTARAILEQVRECLDKSYVPWTVDDGAGGHCVVGCIALAENGDARSFRDMRTLPMLNNACRRLHPELVHAFGPRPKANICSWDDFDFSPAVYVNNQLGKDAILAALDDAIAHEPA